MKTIIAGSREITDMRALETAIRASGFRISEVVCGGARGVDALGASWARAEGIQIKMFPADWGKFGKSAGYRRNQEMAYHAEALIAVWDGNSRGTKHMIDLAKVRGLSVYVHFTSEQTELDSL